MKIIPIDVPELGNRSYLLHDGQFGLVIDPSRRTQQFIDVAKTEAITIEAVFETHIHNDYVTGGYALSQKLGKPYYVSLGEKVDFKRQAIEPEQTVKIGKMEVTAIASPGHTHHHLSYLVAEGESPPALFSGGSLLYGAVGRTDLVSADSTVELAKAQYRTAQFFVDRLDPSTKLYPTHGFGSFCAATETEHLDVSTIKHQIKSNYAYTSKNETEFVEGLIKNLDNYPAYYAYMAPANAKGPHGPNLKLPKSLTAEDVEQALHTGAAIIDMRSRLAFAREHLKGTYNLELGNSFATYIGWLFAWETPVVLVAASPDDVTTAQEQLSLIGREIVAGRINSTDLLKSTNQLVSYQVGTFADLAKALEQDKQLVILDVRRKPEWQKGHLDKAIHIALHELNDRINEIPTDKPVWVHCASGFRAALASSILSNNGRQVVLIDDQYDNAQQAELMVGTKNKFVNQVEASAAQLLDVRDDSEWSQGRATEAIHIPLGHLLDGDLDQLQISQPIYIYCASGKRSGMAERFLNSQGFNSKNIGGLDDWAKAGGSIKSDAAKPTN